MFVSSRIRAIQGYVRVPASDPSEEDDDSERENRPPQSQPPQPAQTTAAPASSSPNPAAKPSVARTTRLHATREAFRRSSSADGVSSLAAATSAATADPTQLHKQGLIRRLSLNDKPHLLPPHHHRAHQRRFSKSPELAETTFTMTTIEEEEASVAEAAADAAGAKGSSGDILQ